MDDFERRLCSQTHSLYIVKTFYMSQMNPEHFSTKLNSQFNYHTLPVAPFKNAREIKNSENSFTVVNHSRH